MICAADSSPAVVAPGFSPACAALKGGATCVRHILAENSEVIAEIKPILFVHLAESITQAGRAAQARQAGRGPRHPRCARGRRNKIAHASTCPEAFYRQPWATGHLRLTPTISPAAPLCERRIHSLQKPPVIDRHYSLQL